MSEQYAGAPSALPMLWLASTEALATKRVEEQALSSLLSRDECERWRGFRLQRDRDLFLVAHYLKRRALSNHIPAVAETELRFVSKRNGKPDIDPRQNDAGLCFNLSHSGQIAAVLVTAGMACGVDVERTRSDVSYLDVARRSFHPTEARDTAARGIEAFYQYWTLKEAFIKLMGAGLSIALDSFCVELEPTLRIVLEAGCASAAVELFQYRLSGGYIVAAAARGRSERWPPKIQWLAELTPGQWGDDALAQPTNRATGSGSSAEQTLATPIRALRRGAGTTRVDRCWLRLTRPTLPRLRLFCFPFAGALPSYFRHWAGRIGPDIELWALQLPGRGTRGHEPLLRDMRAIIAHIAPAIEPILEPPLVFFGHSMGAAVAFELALFLRNTGRALPCHVILSGCLPVHMRRQPPHVHKMDLDQLIAELRIVGGTPEEVLSDRDLLEHYAPAIRADFEVIELHVNPSPQPLQVPVSVWAGTRDPRVAIELVSAWGEHFVGPYEEVHFSGGHMFIDPGQSQGRCLEELNRVLAQCIEQNTGYRERPDTRWRTAT